MVRTLGSLIKEDKISHVDALIALREYWLWVDLTAKRFPDDNSLWHLIQVRYAFGEVLGSWFTSSHVLGGPSFKDLNLYFKCPAIRVTSPAPLPKDEYAHVKFNREGEEK